MGLEALKDHLAVLLAPALYLAFTWLARQAGRRLALVRALSLPLHLLALAGALWLALLLVPEWRGPAMPYLRALLIYALVMLAVRFLDAVLVGYLLVTHRRKNIPSILREFCLLAVYFIVALAVARGSLGWDVTSLVATSAVFSFVLGMASQDILGSLLSGMVLGIEQPLSPGDWIEIDGKEGRVVDITWRRCRVVTRDGDFVLVPNNHVTSKTIINYTRPSELHRLTIPVGVHYRHPPSQVKDCLARAAAHCPGVVEEPAPSVYLLSFDDSAITYRLNAWTRDYGRSPELRSELLSQIWYFLGREGLGIPFPIRTLEWAPPPEARPSPAQERQALVPFLRGVLALETLDQDSLDWLAQQGRLALHGRGQIIFREGQPGDSLYLVHTGQVRVLKDFGEGPTAVASLGPGQAFGEMSPLLGQPRSATIQVEDDAQLLEIQAPVLRQLLERHPTFLEALSRLMEERNRDNAQMQALLAGGEAKGQQGRVHLIMRHIQAVLGLSQD